MSTLKKLEDGLPGVRFHVVTSEVHMGQTRLIGKALITCEIDSKEAWDVVVDKLDGLKLFSCPTEELVAAMSDALHEADEHTRSVKIGSMTLEQQLQEKDEEIARLRAVLRSIEVDLGIAT